MRGNRATRTSGLVRALCFFSLRGADGRDGLFLCFNCLHVCSLSFLAANLVPPFPKFSFPFHSSVSTIPRNWVPPRVSSLICPICVLSVTL